MIAAKYEELKVVTFGNAAVDPGAVVVELTDAYVANLAVLRTGRFNNVTSLALLCWLIHHPIINNFAL